MTTKPTANLNASVANPTGEITATERKAKGKSAFGFDPIFQPVGSGKTFAEMTIEEKNGYSHRAMAIRKFAEWYKKRKPNRKQSVILLPVA